MREQFGDVVIYRGDCREILPSLTASVCVTDPPYGINYKVNARKWSNAGLKTDKVMTMEARPPIAGDDKPFDAAPLLRFGKCAIFGANKMEGLPSGGRWIVWDKRVNTKPDSHSDCEMVWTNRPGADRMHRQLWRGICRAGEENLSRSRKLHTNQKPVALLEFIFDQIGVCEGDTVIDPYMGSGSTGVVALRRGLRFIGIEIDQNHYATAKARLLNEMHQKAMSA